jgi:hypothetical protein
MLTTALLYIRVTSMSNLSNRHDPADFGGDKNKAFSPQLPLHTPGPIGYPDILTQKTSNNNPWTRSRPRIWKFSYVIRPNRPNSTKKRVSRLTTIGNSPFPDRLVGKEGANSKQEEHFHDRHSQRFSGHFSDIELLTQNLIGRAAP